MQQTQAKKCLRYHAPLLPRCSLHHKDSRAQGPEPRARASCRSVAQRSTMPKKASAQGSEDLFIIGTGFPRTGWRLGRLHLCQAHRQTRCAVAGTTSLKAALAELLGGPVYHMVGSRGEVRQVRLALGPQRAMHPALCSPMCGRRSMAISGQLQCPLVDGRRAGGSWSFHC